MAIELYQLPEKIKRLRELSGMSQADLARRLQLSRSSVNGWEMGLFVPSTAVIVELSKIFHVTTDYLLGVEQKPALRVDDLSEEEIAAISTFIRLLQENKSGSTKEGFCDV